MNCYAHSPIVNTARSASYPIVPEINQIIAQLFPNGIKVDAQRRADEHEVFNQFEVLFDAR
jgi:hypothetical protein